MLRRVGNNSIAENRGIVFSAILWRVGNNSIAEKTGYALGGSTDPSVSDFRPRRGFLPRLDTI